MNRRSLLHVWNMIIQLKINKHHFNFLILQLFIYTNILKFERELFNWICIYLFIFFFSFIKVALTHVSLKIGIMASEN